MIFREVEDRDLVAKASRGSVDAYNLLVSRWEKRVFNYILRLVRNREDALDLSQDVFLKAYRKAFPKMFTDPNEMPEGLGEHFRYPTDLFKVQTRQLERYHETNPDEFFNRSNQWAVTPKPSPISLTTTSRVSTADFIIRRTLKSCFTAMIRRAAALKCWMNI